MLFKVIQNSEELYLSLLWLFLISVYIMSIKLLLKYIFQLFFVVSNIYFGSFRNFLAKILHVVQIKVRLSSLNYWVVSNLGKCVIQRRSNIWREVSFSSSFYRIFVDQGKKAFIWSFFEIWYRRKATTLCQVLMFAFFVKTPF